MYYFTLESYSGWTIPNPNPIWQLGVGPIARLQRYDLDLHLHPHPLRHDPNLHLDAHPQEDNLDLNLHARMYLCTTVPDPYPWLSRIWTRGSAIFSIVPISVACKTFKKRFKHKGWRIHLCVCLTASVRGIAAIWKVGEIDVQQHAW